MEKIALWSRNIKTGLPSRKNHLLSVDHYEIIKSFIVRAFEEERSLTLIELLQRASYPALPLSAIPSLNTKLLMVKNDLEARKVLLVSLDCDRRQTIRLNKKKYLDGAKIIR